MSKAAHHTKAELSKPAPPPPLLPADSKDSLLSLKLKQYLKPQDIEQVWQAYRYAYKAHDGVVRKTGEPYITHPVSVACILADLHMDVPTILAALLHDVVEDTPVTTLDIKELYGQQVAELVDGAFFHNAKSLLFPFSS